jgi:hypothetical protein
MVAAAAVRVEHYGTGTRLTAHLRLCMLVGHCKQAFIVFGDVGWCGHIDGDVRRVDVRTEC